MNTLCGKCNKPKIPTVPFVMPNGEEVQAINKQVLDKLIESKLYCNCGRPTTYSEEIIIKTNEYLASREDEEVEQEKKEGWTTYKTKAKLPTIEGLALFLNIDKTTLYDWEKIHPEFSHVMSKLRSEQADRLINSGLSGDYNPTIAKVLLTKHGYIDKQDVTSDGKAIKGNSIVFSNFKDNDDTSEN